MNFSTNQIIAATVTVTIVGTIVYYNYSSTTQSVNSESNEDKVQELLKVDKLKTNDQNSFFDSIKSFFVNGEAM